MKFGTIICDPPWSYTRTSKHEKLRGYSDQHYESLTTRDLMDLDVGRIAADNCVLFLWTTGPFLVDCSAQKVAEAWGFTPITLMYWHKLGSNQRSHHGGVGYWFRGNAEPVLVAKKGRSYRWSEQPGWNSQQNSALFESLKSRHSQKPDYLHELVEASVYPAPYLEMFGRRERPGWTVVGNNGDGGTLENPEDITDSLKRLELL
jgi:N6-adenosine-specific RNA methylase IME4